MPEKSILILTSRFPYLPGEQFLEDEIAYWARVGRGISVILVPTVKGKSIRNFPSDIFLYNRIANLGFFSRVRSVAMAIFSKTLRNELEFLVLSGKISIKTLIVAIEATSKTLYVYFHLKKAIMKAGKVSMIYSYWNNPASYASVLLKFEGLVESVVTRTHGYDLYEENRKYGYMPLKRQFVPGFDKIMVLSPQAESYYREKYKATVSQVAIFPLGVPVEEEYAKVSDDGNFNVVSVSNCIQLKRIDKIILALNIVSERNPSVVISWAHIGDGPLLNQLRLLAKASLAKKNNVTYQFWGNMDNSDVKSYYKKHEIDLFVNASETEGVPVSIMEAMSAGVPVIAPNVGGISFLVTGECGVLLSSNPSCEEIALAIEAMIANSQKEKMRKCCKDRIKNLFNAEKNYYDLVEFLTNMIH